MTMITHSPAPLTGAFAAVRAVLRPIGTLIAALGEGFASYDEFSRLQALSDEDLAARGLRREDLVRHVFRVTV